ncbi:MAG: helix-turn-helix domain-containing protein, partial [Minisyncoccota bacterium]
FSHLVPHSAVDDIHEALAAAGDERLSPVFHALGGRYSFEMLRLARLMRHSARARSSEREDRRAF